MKKPNKEERELRRAKCMQIGSIRVVALRSGDFNDDQVTEMRASVLNGDCPFCEESGFKSIAGHCAQMHGVPSRELRDLLFITFSETICSRDLHEKLRTLNIGRNPQEKAKPSGARKYSKKGELVRNKNLSPHFHLVSKEILAEYGRNAGFRRKGKTPWNKTIEHGNRAMYRQGCRCEICINANKLYWKQSNLSRKKKIG